MQAARITRTKLVPLAVTATVFFVSGFASGNLYRRPEDVSTSKEIRATSSGLINPLLECENFSQSNDKVTAHLRDDIQAVIDEQVSSGKIKDAAIYFRDLNNGPWIGINVGHEFSPASLLKIPLMITLLKQAEEKPGFLAEKLVRR